MKISCYIPFFYICQNYNKNNLNINIINIIKYFSFNKVLNNLKETFNTTLLINNVCIKKYNIHFYLFILKSSGVFNIYNIYGIQFLLKYIDENKKVFNIIYIYYYNKLFELFYIKNIIYNTFFLKKNIIMYINYYYKIYTIILNTFNIILKNKLLFYLF